MSSNDSAIDVANLWKVYDIYKTPKAKFLSSIGFTKKGSHETFEAISDVSFHVGKGEVVGIVGRNGSGKSTLLQLIAGVLQATQGTVALSGRVSAILELGAGFNPEASGRENIYINAAILGYSASAIEGKMNSIIEFADIGSFIERPVKLYSSGMYVRLAFAIAISVEPDVFIVDEALSVGDAAFQRKCFAKIESLRQSGTTILFVSHAEPLVIELCDRAILLEAGKLIYEGRPKLVMGFYNRLMSAGDANLPETLVEIEQQIEQDIEHHLPAASGHRVKMPVDAGFLDPHLISKSAVPYEPQGALIVNPRIASASGEHVNVLVKGQDYVYTYEVEFERALRSVRFGFLIKTISGLEVGGVVSHSAGEGVDNIAAGTRTKVSFRFQCLLNANLYFMNAGVLAKADDEEYYAHRILDAYMFRVQPNENDTATGVVDFRTTDYFELDYFPAD